MSREPKGPKFIQYFGPLVRAINELGGSGRPEEVEDIIVRRLNISEEQQSEVINSGSTRLRNQLHWARFYMAKAGYIDSSVRGVWSLTDRGRESQNLTQQQSLEIFKQVRNGMNNVHDSDDIHVDVSLMDSEASSLGEVRSSGSNYRIDLLQLLRSISASGFEQLCQRLLRESGFERVSVTGRTGDGGIDGIGILQMTPFVSFKVLFQCKRYSGGVGAPQIRDFRGAMAGRADKGLILTTGTFTPSAREEALRDGVPQIELVDGEKLVDLFEKLQLGLKPRTTYDIDQEFFEQFK